jgi:opacity protein-like surface antigen
MNMLTRIFFVLLAGLVVSAPTLAQGMTQGRRTGWEFGLEAVYLDSQNIDFEGGSSASVDDDLGLTLTFGYRFNPNFELQFGIDWSAVDYRANLQSAILPGVSIDVSGEYEYFTPRVNAVYNFRDAPFTPYVSGGIGWAFIDTNIPNSRVQVGCWWDPWYGQICTPYQSTKDVDEFAYQAGVGVRWDISRYYSMRFGYEKQWIDFGNATSTPDFDQLRLSFQFTY